VNRPFVKLFLCLVLALVIPVMSVAATLDRIVKNGEMRVGTSANQPPFSMKDKDGNLMGYEIELATLLAKSIGVEVKFVEKNFSDLLPALEKGEVDVVMSGMTITPDRNLKASFVGPYIISGKSVLTKSATLTAIDEASDMNESSITLVALKGSTSEMFVNNWLSEAKLTTVADYDAAVAMVRNDQVDAMFADFPICALSVLRHPNEGLATLVSPLTIEPIGMALPAGDAQFVNLVQNYLTALQMAGILDGLEMRWFEDGSWLVRLP